MKKTFVLDTNILIHDPQSILSFEDNTVVIPIDVLEELDKFKSGSNGIGRNSRESVRILESLRKKGSLRDGVETPAGGVVRVDSKSEIHPACGLCEKTHDNRILSCAKRLQESGEPTLFLTKDINLRIKADAVGVPTEDYRKDRVEPNTQFMGWRELMVPEEDLNRFFEEKSLKVDIKLYPNEFVHMRAHESRRHTAIAKRDRRDPHTVVPLQWTAPIFGITPRNMEQRMAFELLMDPEISLVTLTGGAGTGKTLLALAAALELAVKEKDFEKILVSRPIMPLGRDIGYLPGSKDEKLELWMQPIFDNLTYLVNPKRGAEGEKRLQDLLRSGVIQLEAITYIRGRSIFDQFIIVDEAQNLTPHEVKTIISRAGDEAKVVLTGDPQQIDNPYLDAASNGLVYVAERMKDQDLAGHVSLSKSERSALASVAAKVL